MELYAWIRKANEATNKPASEGSTFNESQNTGKRKDSIDDLACRFARQGGCWIFEKKKEFDLWDAKALGIIIDGLDTDYAILIDEYETAGAVWTHLRVKYYKTKKSTARINMSAIQTFVFGNDSTIDASWTNLKEYRRRVVAANRNDASVYPDDVLFHVLTSVLYKAGKHANVLDGFLTQNLSVDESLKLLQEKGSPDKEVRCRSRRQIISCQTPTQVEFWPTKYLQ